MNGLSVTRATTVIIALNQTTAMTGTRMGRELAWLLFLLMAGACGAWSPESRRSPAKSAAREAPACCAGASVLRPWLIAEARKRGEPSEEDGFRPVRGMEIERAALI